ncbi:hypothetical protein C8F01DRAFT_1154329 [Mycena amicta]|nr:hypothetical protein C8F01DRAFT_1154329 [Mycena amicta]
MASKHIDRLEEATRLVQTVYENVHKNFVVWKADYAARAMASASLTIPTDGTSSSVGTLPSLSLDSNETPSIRVPMEVTRVADSIDPGLFEPFPVYEYCAPIDRNNHLDDPTFDFAAYFEEFSGVAWTVPRVDPDLEAVVVETARRLHSEHGMEFRLIAETGVLPLELFNRDGRPGMIHMSHRRDFPDWPPGVSAAEKTLPSQTPLAKTVEGAVAMLVTEFCTNLNCMIGFCTTHLDSMPQPLPGPPSTIRNERLRDLVPEPCGNDCFVLREEEDEDMKDLTWDEKTLQLLRFVLKHSSDTLPCDLATICMKPCFEAYAMRCREVRIRRVARGGKGKSTQARTHRKTFNDFDAKQYTPGMPCGHAGPCNASTQCPCFLNGGHCESSCRCGPGCTRRWKGCNCVKRSNIKASLMCRTKTCECFLAHRECDPEMCTKYCHARTCHNTAIQKGLCRKTHVGTASFGLGLFMDEPAADGDLIIEYMGQVIYEDTVDSRDPIAVHRHRNYVFQLNKTLSIDGTYAGNDARYINHDEHRPNCHPRILLVNGEHRIGIFATRALAAGDEVLFNYGPSFFQDDDGVGPSSSARRARVTTG